MFVVEFNNMSFYDFAIFVFKRNVYRFITVRGVQNIVNVTVNICVFTVVDFILFKVLYG